MTKPHRFQFWFALWVLSAVVLALLGILKAPVHADGNAQLQAQGFLLSEGKVRYTRSVQPGDLEWTADDANIRLPDVWNNTQPNFEGQALYKFRFDLDPDKPKPDAVFLPRVVMNAHVYLNGSKIGGYGRVTGELDRYWNFPLMFQFPTTLLKPTGNVLVVQVAGYKNYRSGLGRVWLGPTDAIEPLYCSAYRWQVTGSMLATLVAMGSGLLLAFFSRYAASDQGLLFLGLAVITFALRNIGYFTTWAPLPQVMWAEAVHSLHAWFVCLYGQFLLRYIQHPSRRLRQALWAYAVLVTLTTFAFSGRDILQFTLYMLAPVVPLFFVLNIMLLRHAWIHRDMEATLLGASSMLFVLLSVRDLSIMVDALPIESVLLSQYTGIALFASGCWILLKRFSVMFRQLQDVNQSLNSQLSLRERQLMDQFMKIRQIEQQRTKDEERRRIMQDIHDGVGSSLVSALNENESRPLSRDEMTAVLQDCLDDLRLAIDSLDPQSDDLLALLGNFRWRYERRLKLSGIQLHWRVQDIPKLEGYRSRDLFDLLRIVQEAFGNILKHAKAHAIELSIEPIDGQQCVALCIRDDGCGLSKERIQEGRGMTHMATRARALGLILEHTEGLDGRGFGLRIQIPQQRRY
ncbi:MAG TPA: ATP-binding protein [Limnobacter sp.]|uniref:sensor histidine kinase n=1 Tax=Limnobacter sp. TaxID=2003368 RepID=UPI002ED96414